MLLSIASLWLTGTTALVFRSTHSELGVLVLFLILLCTGFFTFYFFFYLIPSECVHVHLAEGEKGQREHRINPVLLY